MKAHLSFEIIGDGQYQEIRFFKNIMNEMMQGMGNVFFAGFKRDYFVAEINGIDKKFGFSRVFINGKKDYSETNSKGSRGVKAIYILESGKIYEVKHKVSWKSFDRYFCIVADEGEIKKITRNEVCQRIK
jgi:hypothetical protein